MHRNLRNLNWLLLRMVFRLNPSIIRNKLISYMDNFLLILDIRFLLFSCLGFGRLENTWLFGVLQFFGKLLRQHGERGGEILVFHEDALWHVE